MGPMRAAGRNEHRGPRRGERGDPRRGERGAVLVELALVVPILVVLVMGIVDYGMLFSQKIGLRGGVRESAWNGSRGIFGAAPSPACGLTLSGATPDDNTQRLMCMVKHRSGLDPDEIRVKVRTVDLDDGSRPGRYDNGQGLMVCAMRRASSTTHFFSELLDDTFQVARLTTVIISIDPATTTVSGGEERAFSGMDGGWSFCDPDRPAPA